jgi:hypothetical protein
MLSNILAVLTPVIIGLAAVFITERLLQKLAFGRASVDSDAVRHSTPAPTAERLTLKQN